MKAVIGLGNPGPIYTKTRHNFGFLCIDYLALKYNFKLDKSKFNSQVGECNINNEKVIFVKPNTFMNLSGEAVNSMKNYYKLENKDIIVIYDDIDIPFETIRFRTSGSAGTHNGMKHIIEMLNTNSIPRIRLGIGGKGYPNQDLKDYVLDKFSKQEEEKFNEIFTKTNDKLLEFLDNKA